MCFEKNQKSFEAVLDAVSEGSNGRDPDSAITTYQSNSLQT
jgi:hypothetical protein